MKDPQIHPLGLFNISVFNRSDSDTRLRASISFAASTKTKGLDGFGCFVWNEEVLKGSRFYETGWHFLMPLRPCTLDSWRVWHRISSLSGPSGLPSEESSMSPAFTPSSFPMQFHNLNHLELDDVNLTSGALSCAVTICSHCRRDLELKNVQGTVRLPSAFQVGLWQERGHIVQGRDEYNIITANHATSGYAKSEACWSHFNFPTLKFMPLYSSWGTQEIICGSFCRYQGSYCCSILCRATALDGAYPKGSQWNC